MEEAIKRHKIAMEVMENYHKMHFVHEVLLYGFDDETQRFQGVIFNHRLKKVDISYSDVGMAYKDAFKCAYTRKYHKICRRNIFKRAGYFMELNPLFEIVYYLER